jgi:hypothetical protein
MTDLRPVPTNRPNRPNPPNPPAQPNRPIRLDRSALVDLLDRVVDRGAVVSGDVIIQLAGIDLIRLDLRLLLIGIESSRDRR